MSQVCGWAVGLALLVAGVGPWWWLTGCTAPEPAVPAMDDPKKSDFATGDGKVAEVKFDPERSLKYLKQLCDIGPRISGTEGMKKQQELIEKHFKGLGATVTRQEFKARQRSQKNQTEFTNLVVSWNPDAARRVLLCTHYDTRPIADQEANPKNWNKPFVSANDGASGVAFLMELGHHMKDLKCALGVDFIIFDGEEFVFEVDRALGGGDRYFIGSEHFAEDYEKSKDKRKFKYEAGVLFDLFAGKGAELKVEIHSWEFAKPLVEQIWGVAKAVGAKSFKLERGHEVLDDHIALNKAGIPTADVIDFDYPHWHKLSDTPDKVSGDQLAEVAKVITTWLQKIK